MEGQIIAHFFIIVIVSVILWNIRSGNQKKIDES